MCIRDSEIAKHFAGNNVDVIIYAVEKSLDSYKFNLCLLYTSKTRTCGFEKIERPFNNYFDLAVSNIPFGDIAVFDPESVSYTHLRWRARAGDGHAAARAALFPVRHSP